MATSDIVGTSCPDCGYEFELATGVDHPETPSSGDVSICVVCGAVALFTVSDTGVLGMRKPSSDELTDIYRESPEILTIQRDTLQTLMRLLHPSKLK